MVSSIKKNFTKPTISIVIPTYNRFSLLKEAVMSCLNQSLQNIEIIIVDDGSTDGTELQVAELLKSDWNNGLISYYRQPNSGASSARNLGLQKARGEYIQFLDSDDLIFPNKLELQLIELRKDNAEVCICYGYMGSDLEAKSNKVIGSSFSNNLDLMHKMCSGIVHVMQTSAPLWQKSFLDDNLGWNNSIAFGDDLEYHVRLLANVSKICFVSKKLFFIREHSEFRLSDSKANLKQIRSGILTQKCIYDNLKTLGLWDKNFQTGVITNLKTLYANFMQLATSKELYNFEKFFQEVARNPTVKKEILVLIDTRRFLGANVILSLFKIKKRIFG